VQPLSRTSILFALTLGGLTGCDVYERRQGEYNAGPVDPVTFPPEYLGAGGNRQRAGSGTFTALGAYAQGNPIEYFMFSFSPRQLAAGGDPLELMAGGQPNPRVPTPVAYVFDSDCLAPPGYVFDPARDDVHLDEQGNLFTALPTATYNPGELPTTDYVPLVSEVAVASNHGPCQDIKSETTLLTRQDVTLAMAEPVNGQPTAAPDGRYLAWAVIEPGAAVCHVNPPPTTACTPEGGLGLQRWGWFNHYLLAYLEGGYVPTVESGAEGNPVVRMVPQGLYYPRSPVGAGASVQPGALGQGYDVMDAARSQGRYSPICAVFTYDAGEALPASELPRDVPTLLVRYGATVSPANPPYVYCLQVQ